MTIAQVHVYSAFSLLKSTNRIDQLVEQARAKGYQALALTDWQTMAGSLDFAAACNKVGLVPLFGLTSAYRWLNPEGEVEEHTWLFLAKNQAGFRQLLKIASLPYEHPENKNQQAFEDLVKLLSPDIVAVWLGDNLETSTEELHWLAKAQKQTPIYFGIEPSMDFETAQRFCTTTQLIPLAVHRTRYLEADAAFAVDVLQHIEEGTRVNLEEKEGRGEEYLYSLEDFSAAYEAWPEPLNNLSQVVDTCQVELDLHQTLLPHYPVPHGAPADAYLQALCEKALPLRIEEPSKIYHDRLAKELNIIHQMGFDDYFLIVWDVMRYAHRQGYFTGSGRGSAAGSLVAYVLGITDVDPIAYQLLFERFLNPERYTMPDIDLDIPDLHREDLLQYVAEKYGHGHVAQIATFGTMAAKMVIRDVARVFGLSQNEANQWSKTIPNVLKISLKAAYDQSVPLQKLVRQSPKNQLLFETAVQLEGLPRHVSTHAAGVVISDQELTDYVPLQEGTNGLALTQYTMENVEAIGLLKMDFLGLRNLTIMDQALKNVQKLTGKTLKAREIPFDDPETLRLFRTGQTAGIFQFESAGIRNVLRKVQPNSIEDIVAVNALYRPGPMENIETFTARKLGKEEVTYPDASLETILAPTYGIIVYQEQIMQVAAKMAGFTLGQADILRRAISKKKKEVIDQERQHFVDGACQNGYSEEVATEVYDYIERFANYGFNRSHAVAYSFVGYQMAYLKTHYPAAFFGALLESVRQNPAKIKEYSAEAKKMGVPLGPPNINQSAYGFTLENGRLLFGFSSLKGMRRDFIRSFIEERKQNGAYRSLDDFLLRLDARWLKEDALYPLIFIGAFDAIEPNRRELVMNLPSKIKNIEFSGGSLDIFETLTLKSEVVEDYTLEERLEQEEEYLGTYLSGHPLDHYQNLRELFEFGQVAELAENQFVRLLVYVKEQRSLRTKKGEAMAFFTADDGGGEVSITVFPKVYRGIQQTIQTGAIYVVSGKVEYSQYNQSLQVVANQLQTVDAWQSTQGRVCYIRFTKENQEDRETVIERLTQTKGKTPVVFYLAETKEKLVLNEQQGIRLSIQLLDELQDKLGAENVILK